jgi:hypothetical protein
MHLRDDRESLAFHRESRAYDRFVVTLRDLNGVPVLGHLLYGNPWRSKARFAPYKLLKKGASREGSRRYWRYRTCPKAATANASRPSPPPLT